MGVDLTEILGGGRLLSYPRCLPLSPSPLSPSALPRPLNVLLGYLGLYLSILGY